MKTITHNNVNFWVEKININGEEKFQAFYGEGFALSSIEEKEFVAICFAIKYINENEGRF